MRQSLVDVHDSAHFLDVLDYKLVVGDSEAVVSLNVLEVGVLRIASHELEIAFPLFFLDNGVECLCDIIFSNNWSLQILNFLNHGNEET
jgi:hypothetical protein